MNYRIVSMITRGLMAETTEGEPLRLAVLDKKGKVVVEGKKLEKALGSAGIAHHRAILTGAGKCKQLA